MDGGDTRDATRDLYFIRLGKLENKLDAEAISIIPRRKIDESHRDRVAFSFPIGPRRDLESGQRSIFLSRGEIPPKARLLHKRYDISPIGNYC